MSTNLLRLLAVFIFYAFVTAIWFAPILPHLSSSLLGPPEDNLQDLWNSWYAAVGNAQGPHFFFTNLIKFPEGTTLYYHSIAYPQVLSIWLAVKAFGNSLPALVSFQNLIILLSFPLAGVGAFCLSNHVTRNAWCSLLGGFVFAFNPSHVLHAMHHVHVASIEFIPFFVLSYWLAIEKKSLAWLLATIAFFALSALSCWYYLFYCFYFIIFHTTYQWFKERRAPQGWGIYILAASLCGVGIVLSPWLVPMVKEALVGQNVYMGGTDYYVADLLAYFTFPLRHFFGAFSVPIYREFSGNPWEATAYLGLANIGIFVWLLINRLRSNRELIIYLTIGIVVFAILASGSYLHILGRDVFPMPDLLLSKIPFFRNIRAPSRAIVFVYLFLSVGLSLGMQLLFRETS